MSTAADALDLLEEGFDTRLVDWVMERIDTPDFGWMSDSEFDNEWSFGEFTDRGFRPALIAYVKEQDVTVADWLSRELMI